MYVFNDGRQKQKGFSRHDMFDRVVPIQLNEIGGNV